MTGFYFTIALVCAFVGGCGIAPEPMERPAATVDLDAVISRAGGAKRPLVVLVGELGPHGADRAAGALIEKLNANTISDTVEFLNVDLANSANRANAARFHLAQTPVLVCLSPMGVIVSRDQGPITAELLGKRLDGLQKRAADLDAQFASLLNEIDSSKQLLVSRRHLSDFLLAHQNDREAIPYLAEIASSELADPTDRIDACVSMARAHLWIGEPEKARHEAKDLIATLGPNFPDAIAGGNLVLGLQDTVAKRFSLARQEFDTAVKADPASDYAKQAGEALALLPKESR